MPWFPWFAREPRTTVHDRRGRGAGTASSGAVSGGAVVAGAAAVLLLLGAGSVALFGGGDPATVAPPPSLARPSSPSRPAAATTPSTGLVSGVQPAGAAYASPVIEPLLTAPPVTWELFSGVALPYSPTAGPHTVDGPVYAGYQRSQVGALIAAAQLGTRSLLTPGQGWREVSGRQLLPGPGRAVFLAARATVDELTVPPGTYGQFAGFRVVTFTPDVAVLQLVSRFALTGRLQLTTTTVRWVGGDWRLELQPDGGSSPTAQAVPNLDGFVVWGGA